MKIIISGEEETLKTVKHLQELLREIEHEVSNLRFQGGFGLKLETDNETAQKE